MKHIYVVVSQTGSIVSRMIKRFTGDKYCHSSISLDDNLDTMYSFGRIYANNPLIGGFVKESVKFGAMKKFSMADAVVIRLDVTQEKYDAVNNYIQAMYSWRTSIEHS